MDFVTQLVVGLSTGLLASLFADGTLSRVGHNLVNGVLGAFLASWLVAVLNLQIPVSGSIGPILVALSGAIGLLLVLGAARQARRGWDRWTRGSTRTRAWRSVPRAR
jgi:uncharacterized membrane protein YeaQ/YmgE (transglycosylase-associated protein family)